MLNRFFDGVPPVTLQGFAELAGWLEANSDRVYSLAGREGLIDLAGRKVNLTNLLYGITKGAKASGAWPRICVPSRRCSRIGASRESALDDSSRAGRRMRPRHEIKRGM